jgi:hypothetical protein
MYIPQYNNITEIQRRVVQTRFIMIYDTQIETRGCHFFAHLAYISENISYANVKNINKMHNLLKCSILTVLYMFMDD